VRAVMADEHLLVAIVGLIGVALTAGVTLTGIVLAHQKTNERIAASDRKTEQMLDTGNGHTVGVAVARVEEQGWRHEHRLDAIEVELREARSELKAVRNLTEGHLEEVAPLVGFVVSQMEKGESE
jgi:hypothetical protein